MNFKAKIARTCFLIGLCLLSATGTFWRYNVSQAQDYPTSVLELRTNTPPRYGESYVVDVYANIAAPAYGFGLQVQYDPAVLQPELQTEADGSAVPLRIGGPFIGAQRIRNTQTTAETGSVIDVVYTLLPPADPAIGEGFIGRLTFTVLQETPSTLELISPRLIALTDGAAVDLPVAPVPALAFFSAPTAETVVQQPAPVAQPEAAPVQPLPAAAPVVEAPVETVLANLNTSSDILAQMNQTNALMNAALVGLLTMTTILLAVISISSVLDSVEASRHARLVPARAYASASAQPARRTPASQRMNASALAAENARLRLKQRAQPRRHNDMRDL